MISVLWFRLTHPSGPRYCGATAPAKRRWCAVCWAEAQPCSPRNLTCSSSHTASNTCGVSSRASCATWAPAPVPAPRCRTTPAADRTAPHTGFRAVAGARPAAPGSARCPAALPRLRRAAAGQILQIQRQEIRQFAAVDLQPGGAVLRHQVNHRLAAIARLAVHVLKQQQ